MQRIFLSCIFIKILLNFIKILLNAETFIKINVIIVTVYKGGQYEISLG